MADIRTPFNIPKNTWVLVTPGGGQSGVIRREVTTPSYINLVFDDAISDPNALYPLPVSGKPETAVEMFEDSNIENVADPVPVYIWVACQSEKAGKVLVAVV